MLSFKRILGSEFPLRMLPLDQLELQMDEDGFDMIVSTPTTVSQRSSPRSIAASSNPGTDGASKRRKKSKKRKDEVAPQ